MKNNTQQTKSLLMQALKSVPEDFALSVIKTQIQAAISKLEQVEVKRQRRETPVKSNQWPVVNGQVTNPFAVKNAIDMIDEMIASEKDKIEEIHKRRKTNHDIEGEDFSAIFG